MRVKGINFDTGFFNGRTSTREPFEPDETERVDAAFVYTFARYDLKHRDDPQADLDMASRGVVKVFDQQSAVPESRGRRYPDMPWKPKAAFDVPADLFAP